MSRMSIGQALEIAVQHHNSGRLAEAVDIYTKILVAEPKHHAAMHLLGVAAHEGGDLERAHGLITQAIDLQPDAAGMHGNLGLVLQDMGRPGEAIASFRTALSLDPEFATAHCNLGGALQVEGKVGEALVHHRQAVDLEPENNAFWAGLAGCVQTMLFTAIDDSLLADLLALLDRPDTDPPAVAPAILSALRLHPDIARMLAATVTAKDTAVLAEIPLLCRIMALSPLKDLALEELLTTLRRAMLTEEWHDRALPFAVALAHHCFVNEYVFAETPEETALVAHLEPGAETPAQLAMLGAYRPLHRFTWSEALLERKWSEDIAALLARQVAAPLMEQALRHTIPRLTDIGGGVSAAVRNQYEENPYPRWVRFGGHGAAAGVADVLRGPPFEFTLDGYEPPNTPEILIAGCGTGQHALLTAGRFAGARILAVDLSLASLAYASRMTSDLGVSNIEYAQADILALGGLDRRFDVIESVGVLHHLADPVAGWRILVDLLRPGGVMKIGLYSETGRQDVAAGRALIAEQGFDASPAGIRRCRREIAALAQGGAAAMARIAQRDSFFTTSECRDLLFHVQEHCFTLPQIEAALEKLELEFLGFEFADRSASAPASLAHWHRVETGQPDIFAGMYEFWARKPHATAVP